MTVFKRGKNKVGEDGVIKGRKSNLVLKRCDGSFYKELIRALRKKLEEKGDWVWIKNCDTNEVILASGVENYTKRYYSI